MREYIPNYIVAANREGLSLTTSLLELTNQELAFQKNQTVERVIQRARFPKRSSLEDFDFDFQPSLNKKEILDLKHMGFMEKKENLVFIGNPGVGKTHLVIAVGIEACHQGYRTLFISCHELLLRLRSAFEKGTVDRVLRRYARYDLLIIDEIGYLPIQKVEANLFFQLMTMRYEKKPTLITTNIILSRWGELFQNTEIAAAILDRLVHHVKVFKMTGKSYRMKEKT
ncbi:Mobile element protein [Marinilactibacillus psychrotolerans 42ea]|uniref:Mobile element protein n=1 Tax=Marinilactibacillus psychrotolerans 42ea TaxID=1255609 RepID=A0A1R4K191_9LACT|nr:IS21-like element helper ATPase IstB [Marinilactibacillus psychrotolerans]SJN37835.1 Mobile element protein [Marinilactibacillus psychrotolerans 42ea]